MEPRTIQIRVAPELWGTSIMPQGILQKWLQPDGALVEAGEPVAFVQIEDGLHALTAPAAGWLKQNCPQNAILEPGAVIGQLGLP